MLELTEEKINTLPAGLETDTLMVITLFGWRWLYVPELGGIGLWPPEYTVTGKETPGSIYWLPEKLPSTATLITDPDGYERLADWHTLGSCYRVNPDGSATFSDVIHQGVPPISTTYTWMEMLIKHLAKPNALPHLEPGQSLWWTANLGYSPDQPAYAGFGVRESNGYGWSPADYHGIGADDLPLATARAALKAAHSLGHGGRQINDEGAGRE